MSPPWSEVAVSDSVRTARFLERISRPSEQQKIDWGGCCTRTGYHFVQCYRRSVWPVEILTSMPGPTGRSNGMWFLPGYRTHLLRLNVSEQSCVLFFDRSFAFGFVYFFHRHVCIHSLS
jgi:hypothetical protein